MALILLTGDYNLLLSRKALYKTLQRNVISFKKFLKIVILQA